MNKMKKTGLWLGVTTRSLFSNMDAKNKRYKPYSCIGTS